MKNRSSTKVITKQDRSGFILIQKMRSYKEILQMMGKASQSNKQGFGHHGNTSNKVHGY